MHRLLSTWRRVDAARRPAGLATVALVLALAGCKNDTEAVPEAGTEYYPVAVGRFWTYAVTDTVWGQSSYANGQVVRGSVTVTNYQQRETIAATFADAAGNTAYRLVRARRANATSAWTNDSVFVVTANPQFVAVNRGNVRTLEAVFPVKEGGKWHVSAFVNNASGIEDTVKTRQYSRLGQPFTTGNGTSLPPTTYAATVTTTNIGPTTENNLLTLRTYQQVLAKGIGPVFRNRRNLLFFNYTESTGNQAFPVNAYSLGSAVHRETLIDHGM